MSHPLEIQIARLRGKVRRLVWLHGLSLVVAFTLGTALLLAVLDYGSHFSLAGRRVFADSGIRVICTLAVVGVFLWSCYRYLFRGVRARFQDLDLALRAGGRFPNLRDQLAVSIEFLQEAEDDPQAGSPSLRRAVIAETTAAIEELELSEAVNARPALKAGAFGVFAALLVALAFVLDPASSRIALARLVNPLGGPDWPQETHLKFQDAVARHPAGQPLELVVVDVDGDPLPKYIKLYVRYDGTDEEQELAMRPRDDTAFYQFHSVSRPFVYWAEGGDDQSMRRRPRRLEVIEPPLVETLQVRLHPPAYTNWPATDSDKHIRALEGTRVEFHGTSTKPLKAALLCMGHEDKPEVQVRAEIVDNGHGFRLLAAGENVFTVTRSGQYWFRLVDSSGIESDDAKYRISHVADTPPGVSIDEPSRDMEYTAGAVVPLRIVAKDNLALRDVQLRFSRSDRSEQGEVSVELYTGPKQPLPQPQGLASRTLGETRTVTHRWELAALNLPPGTQVTFHATASDYRPGIGQSPSRRLRIITPDELLERISERQRYILTKLLEVLKLQRTARSQLSGVQIQLKEVGRLEKPDLDRLEGTKLVQDRVNSALTNDKTGVTALIGQLLSHLADNRVDNPDIRRRMQALLAEINGLKRNQLPAIASELDSAGRAARSKLDARQMGKPDPKLDRVIAKDLTAAGVHQDEVIDTLERLLGQMTEWDNFHRFSRDVAALRREHEQVQRETAKVGRETLTKDFKDLTPQQQANLKKLAKRQQDLARRFDAILQRMQRMKGELEEKGDPLAAGVLDDALHHARSKGLSNQMRRTADNLQRNQIGQAGGRQKQIDADLQEMQTILANRRERSLSRLVKKLKDAERELQDLINRQKGLQKKLQAAAANPNEEERKRQLKRLTEQQRRLQQETERFARKLQRLRAQRAASKASSAAGQMGQAGKQSQGGDAKNAEKTAEKAAEKLEEAAEDLADARRQAEVELANEQLAKIQDTLEGLKNRQTGIIAETVRLDEIRGDGKPLTPGQEDSVRTLSRQEIQLMQDTQEFAEKLKEAAVFAAALKGAASELELAADLLAGLQIGADTQKAEYNALRRFEQLLESLKPEPSDKQPKQKKKKGGGGNNGPQPNTDGVPHLAQLKLLKMMQVEINLRTKEIDGRLAGKKPDEITEVERRERAIVGDQQGEIRRLILNLSKPTEKDPEGQLGFSLDDLGGFDENPIEEKVNPKRAIAPKKEAPPKRPPKAEEPRE